jgi:hypothetical protein
LYKSENKGLISEDRRNKPTLPLTIPHSVIKSSTKDLSQPIFEIIFRTVGNVNWSQNTLNRSTRSMVQHDFLTKPYYSYVK